MISFFVTVGNYDYGFFWYLYQDGTVQLEAKLTGIVQTAAVAPGNAYRYGGMIDDNLGGPAHQHFFHVRLHMDVDGGGNSVTEHEFQSRPMGDDNPYGNVFDTTSRTFRSEQDAIRVADGAAGRYWKVINPNVANSVGNPTGYKLIVQGGPVMLAQDGSSARRRGAFATKHLWVTPFHPDEEYATGDYPNVHAGGDGLPRYVEQNRSIQNADIVLWHSLGHTHVAARGFSGDAVRVRGLRSKAGTASFRPMRQAMSQQRPTPRPSTLVREKRMAAPVAAVSSSAVAHRPQSRKIARGNRAETT